jgi:poly-gamma-glutamate synthesis protein (capsule biosynthesis protein)
MLLVGSASAAFLVGSGLEILRQYHSPSTFQASEDRAFGSRRFALGQTNTIWSALENVPVVEKTVVNPQDPAVTLLFTNQEALNRGGSGTAIAAYQSADLVMTSLDHLPPNLQSQAVSSAPASLSVSPSSTGVNGEASSLDTATSSESLSNGSEAEAEIQNAEPTVGASSDLEATETGTETESGGSEVDAIAPDSPEGEDTTLLSIQDLAHNGVDVVNLASDNLLTDGSPKLAQAKDLLRQNGVYALGAGQNSSETRRPLVFDIKGQRIAILGYSNATEHPADHNKTGINAPTQEQIAEDIKAIRDQVDWVIVNYQWNKSPKAYAEDWQRQLARFAVEQGADLVVGNAPGVTQGAEIYQGRAIAYSIGNSMEEFNEEEGTLDSVALKITLVNRKMQVDFLPVKAQQGQAEFVQGDSAQKILNQVKQASSFFDQPLQSATVLDGQINLTLPTAPQSSMPQSDPFISYPSDQVP